MDNDAKIHVEGWFDPPDVSRIVRLSGRIVDVIVEPGDWPPGPIPGSAFFRFARVHSVKRAYWLPLRCPRCKSRRRFRIQIEWEAGYVSPNGNIVCEYCLTGIIQRGEEKIPFGDEKPLDGSTKMVKEYNLEE